MNLAEFAFTAIDVLGFPLQNSVHFKNVTCVKDIPYSKAGGRLTSGDLYFPTGIQNDEKKHPIILYIHGGGFIKGDKDYRISVSEYYANEGYYVYCINNRLSPDSPFPETVFDCVDALCFLPELAKKYNIDLSKIVLTGDSSGAYMCSYTAALKFDGELRKQLGCRDIPVDIKGLMLMCGIYDMDVLLKGTKLFGVIPRTGTMFLNFQLKSDLSNIKDYPMIDCVSPEKYVNENWCSTFMCWADDDIVCQGQGEPMAEKLKAVVPHFDYYHCKGFINNHCYHLMLKGNKYAKECMQKSAEFLKVIFNDA